jgi:pyridoxamine 5'-phosphate oxidase
MPDPRSIDAPTGVHPDRTLDRDDLAPDPVAQFLAWLGDAEERGVAMPNAMALATADAEGRPSVRHVLLRGVDARGFVFFTNRESRKGGDLRENPHAAAVFLWKEVDRQVSLAGAVEPVDDEESDAYFASRPRDAQLGAWASEQSRPIADRAALDDRVAEMDARFVGVDVPRPPHWGGYRIVPDTLEFWQGRQHRLHDRFRYTRGPDGWRIDRLNP